MQSGQSEPTCRKERQKFSAYVAYAASSTLYVTDRAIDQPTPQPKPALTDFGLQPCSHE